LRRALHSFTKRADIIIRQLSYLNSQGNSDILDVCRGLSRLPPEQFGQRMDSAAERLAGVKLQLVDPGQVKLQERKRQQPVQTAVAEVHDLDPEAQRDIHIQQLLDQAFATDNRQLRDYVFQALRHDGRLSTRQLPITSAHELLAMAHAIEVGAVNNLGTSHQFRVEPTGNRGRNDYFDELDEFTIELIKSDD